MPNYGRIGGSINATGSLASRMGKRGGQEHGHFKRGGTGNRVGTGATGMRPRNNMMLQMKNLHGVGNRREQRQYQQMMGGTPPTGPPPTTGPGVPNPNPPATGPGFPPAPQPSGGPGYPGTGTLSGALQGGPPPGWDGQPINPIEPTPAWQGPIQPDMGGYANWQPTMYGTPPPPQQGIQMPGPQGREAYGQPWWM